MVIFCRVSHLLPYIFSYPVYHAIETETKWTFSSSNAFTLHARLVKFGAVECALKWLITKFLWFTWIGVCASHRKNNDEKNDWIKKTVVIILTVRHLWGTERSSSAYECVDSWNILWVNTFYLVWSTTFLHECDTAPIEISNGSFDDDNLMKFSIVAGAVDVFFSFILSYERPNKMKRWNRCFYMGCFVPIPNWDCPILRCYNDNDNDDDDD